MLHTLDAVPAAYEGFEVVNHLDEVNAKFSRNGLAVEIRVDDLARWGVHGVFRIGQR